MQQHVVHLDNGRWHSGQRVQPVTLIVMHCTAGGTAKSSIDWLNRPGAPPGNRASYNYVIERMAHIYRMLPPDRVAWHAGDSWFPAEPTLLRQRKTVNPFSIGIAWANKNNGEPLTPFQIAAADWLCRVFLKRYGLPPSRIRGHYEVSPGRKSDPKPCMDMDAWRARFR